MKNQYFADLKDYYKYGILRGFVKQGLNTSICWMLTQDTNNTEGLDLKYLDNPSEWKDYNPELFDKLNQVINIDKNRDINQVEKKQIVPSDLIFDKYFDYDQKETYFKDYLTELGTKNIDLIFFDPDTGIKPKNTSKDLSEYIDSEDLNLFHEAGHSVIVIQFLRIINEKNLKPKLNLLFNKIDTRNIFTLIPKTSMGKCIFFIIPQEKHKTEIEKACKDIESRWAPKITFSKYDKENN